MLRIRERGVGVWLWEEISRNGFGYVINFAMDTKFTPNGFAYVFINSRSVCFGDLHASTSAHQDQ